MSAEHIVAPISARRVLGQANLQQITLTVPDHYHFQTGQYLLVVHPDGPQIPLSIASIPSDLPELTLLYRSTPGDDFASAMDTLLDGEHLTLTPAQGDALCPDQRDVLLVAGGTGISQVLACARQRQRQQQTSAVLWCVDQADDLVLTDVLSACADLTTVVDPTHGPANQGLAWLRQRAEQSPPDQVLISGSPAFVYAVTDVLLEAGLPGETLSADAYAYAPR